MCRSARGSRFRLSLMLKPVRLGLNGLNRDGVSCQQSEMLEELLQESDVQWTEGEIKPALLATVLIEFDSLSGCPGRNDRAALSCHLTLSGELEYPLT